MLSELLPVEQFVAWLHFIDEMPWKDVEKNTGIGRERARKIFTPIYKSVSTIPRIKRGNSLKK
jgi:hypothetical protein